MYNAKTNRKKDRGGAGAALAYGAIGLAVTLAAALVLPLAALKSSDPLSGVTPLALACVALGCFTAAFIAAFRCEIRPLFAGLLSLVPTAVAVAAVTLILPGGRDIIGIAAPVAAALLSSLAGAFAAKVTRGKKRRARKNR